MRNFTQSNKQEKNNMVESQGFVMKINRSAVGLPNPYKKGIEEANSKKNFSPEVTEFLNQNVKDNDKL